MQQEDTPNPKKQLETMIDLYLATNPLVRPDRKINELEIRFGSNPKKGKYISKMEYDNVVKKLLACGFKADNMDGTNMLRISHYYVKANTGETRQSDLRAEIMGSELVEQYCRTNSIQKLLDMTNNNENKIKFTRKESAKDSNEKFIKKVFFNDFNFSIAYNLESDFNVKSNMVSKIVSDWPNLKKTFRYINRVRFEKYDSPIAIDISIIRTSHTSNGFMIPEYTVADAELFSTDTRYEIEMEVRNEKVGKGTAWSTSKSIIDAIMGVARIVLSGIQYTNYPRPYPDHERVLLEYMRLLYGEKYEPNRKLVSKNFCGPSSITLQMSNIMTASELSDVPNIRMNYCVTDKADGERKLLYVDSDGLIYFIDTNMNVQFTGSLTVEKVLFGSLLDGEHIKYDKHEKFIDTYAAFDIYYIAGKSVREQNFMYDESTAENPTEEMKRHRLPKLHSFVSRLKPVSIIDKTSPPQDFKVVVKSFLFSNRDNSMFVACSKLLSDIKDGIYPYNTDGLIFTPINTGVAGNSSGQAGPLEKPLWKLSFKWKPPQYNTIDFLVRYKYDKNGVEEIHNVFDDGQALGASGAAVTQYRTITLYCGFDKRVHSFMNPFQDLLDDKYHGETDDMEDESGYTAKPFQPTNPYDPVACFTNILLKNDQHTQLMFTEEGDIFESEMIVEFSYDPEKPKGWRWIPLRVRHDKTYELRSGVSLNFGNAYHVANDNWKSIHHPITEEMLSTGANIPNDESVDDVYYNKADNDGVSYTVAMRNFHNLYVKKKLIMGVSARGNTLIDYAVGKAGDLSKWKYSKLAFVFGVDISKDNIYNQKDGACARYLNEKRASKRLFDAIFLPGTSALNLRDGSAFFNDKERDIAMAVFGQGSRDATKLGKAVYRNFGKGEKGFNVSSCQFATHYFFENATTLHGFVRNLSENTAPGGYFVGTCYDGQTVFDLLKGHDEGAGFSLFVEGRKIFEILKMYSQSGFTDDETSLGYPINVFQETIGKHAVEYLVNFDYFARVMENYGFHVVSDEEAIGFGFKRGTGKFADLFQMMEAELRMRPKAAADYGKAPMMSREEKQISFMNRYFIFKKTHNVNAKKAYEHEKTVEKMVEKENAKFEKEVAEMVKGEEEGRVVMKIKKLGKKKLQIQEYSPIVETPDETNLKKEMEIVRETVAPSVAPVVEPVVEPSVVKHKITLKKKPALEEKEEEAEEGEKGEKVKRCPKGTRKYKPLGDGCYTTEQIEGHKARKK